MDCLYRHFNEDNTLLYVGITSCPHKRFRMHRAESEWMKTVETITMEHFTSKKEALIAEKIAIQTEHPTYNKMHKIDHDNKINMEFKNVIFKLDGEVRNIIDVAKNHYSIDVDRLLGIFLKEFREYGYSLYHRISNNILKVDIDEECEMIVEAIHMVEGLELNSVIDRLLKDFKSNGYKFKESEETK